jgi:hypothetical protein
LNPWEARILEVSVKLTSHAKERMQDRFKPPLTLNDITEAMVKGDVYSINGRHYIKYKNICLVLASRLTSESDFHIVTILDLKRNKLGKKCFIKTEKTAFKRVRFV